MNPLDIKPLIDTAGAIADGIGWVAKKVQERQQKKPDSAAAGSKDASKTLTEDVAKTPRPASGGDDSVPGAGGALAKSTPAATAKSTDGLPPSGSIDSTLAKPVPKPGGPSSSLKLESAAPRGLEFILRDMTNGTPITQDEKERVAGLKLDEFFKTIKSPKNLFTKMRNFISTRDQGYEGFNALRLKELFVASKSNPNLLTKPALKSDTPADTGATTKLPEDRPFVDVLQHATAKGPLTELQKTDINTLRRMVEGTATEKEGDAVIEQFLKLKGQTIPAEPAEKEKMFKSIKKFIASPPDTLPTIIPPASFTTPGASSKPAIPDDDGKPFHEILEHAATSGLLTPTQGQHYDILATELRRTKDDENEKDAKIKTFLEGLGQLSGDATDATKIAGIKAQMKALMGQQDAATTPPPGGTTPSVSVSNFGPSRPLVVTTEQFLKGLEDHEANRPISAHMKMCIETLKYRIATRPPDKGADGLPLTGTEKNEARRKAVDAIITDHLSIITGTNIADHPDKEKIIEILRSHLGDTEKLSSDVTEVARAHKMHDTAKESETPTVLEYLARQCRGESLPDNPKWAAIQEKVAGLREIVQKNPDMPPRELKQAIVKVLDEVHEPVTLSTTEQIEKLLKANVIKVEPDASSPRIDKLIRNIEKQKTGETIDDPAVISFMRTLLVGKKYPEFLAVLKTKFGEELDTMPRAKRDASIEKIIRELIPEPAAGTPHIELIPSASAYIAAVRTEEYVEALQREFAGTATSDDKEHFLVGDLRTSLENHPGGSLETIIKQYLDKLHIPTSERALAKIMPHLEKFVEGLDKEPLPVFSVPEDRPVVIPPEKSTPADEVLKKLEKLYPDPDKAAKAELTIKTDELAEIRLNVSMGVSVDKEILAYIASLPPSTPATAQARASLIKDLQKLLSPPALALELVKELLPKSSESITIQKVKREGTEILADGREVTKFVDAVKEPKKGEDYLAGLVSNIKEEFTFGATDLIDTDIQAYLQQTEQLPDTPEAQRKLIDQIKPLLLQAASPDIPLEILPQLQAALPGISKEQLVDFRDIIHYKLLMGDDFQPDIERLGEGLSKASLDTIRDLLIASLPTSSPLSVPKPIPAKVDEEENAIFLEEYDPSEVDAASLDAASLDAASLNVTDVARAKAQAALPRAQAFIDARTAAAQANAIPVTVPAASAKSTGWLTAAKTYVELTTGATPVVVPAVIPVAADPASQAEAVKTAAANWFIAYVDYTNTSNTVGFEAAKVPFQKLVQAESALTEAINIAMNSNIVGIDPADKAAVVEAGRKAIIELSTRNLDPDSFKAAVNEAVKNAVTERLASHLEANAKAEAADLAEAERLAEDAKITPEKVVIEVDSYIEVLKKLINGEEIDDDEFEPATGRTAAEELAELRGALADIDRDTREDLRNTDDFAKTGFGNRMKAVGYRKAALRNQETSTLKKIEKSLMEQIGFSQRQVTDMDEKTRKQFDKQLKDIRDHLSKMKEPPPPPVQVAVSL
jgi:hypothetical protein